MFLISFTALLTSLLPDCAIVAVESEETTMLWTVADTSSMLADISDTTAAASPTERNCF